MSTRTRRPAASGRSVRDLVDPERGFAGRAIYVDRDIYELELERVFARSWLYVGHESQLREPGDYLTTFMGEDPVIVVRGADGVIRAFLNACRHRGMRVCRADEGNTSFFRCPYHSWTYSNEGRLRGVPRYRQAYEGVLDRDAHGLREVAQLDSHNGLLFANWDPQAPPLLDYLGGFAKILDLAFARDPAGIEFVGGAHKWTVESNWKHPAENFACDMYHVSSAHQRPAELGMMGEIEDEGYEISSGMGYVGHQLSGPVAEDWDDEDRTVHSYWALPNPYTYPLKDQRERMAELVGPDLARLIPLGHATVFPNFSLLDIEMLKLVRLNHPVGPDRVMIHQWCVLDASLPDEVKEALRKQYEFSFGPSGLLEQDDGENWRECQNGMRGFIGRQLEHNMQLGLGQERKASEFLGEGVPGRGGGIWSEHNQRQFMRHWLAFVGSDGGWAELGPRLAAMND
jgi:3-phenylpropionate/trans-cinnamate dioxygenase subunit alpha